MISVYRFSNCIVSLACGTAALSAGMVTVDFDETGINAGSDFVDYDVVANQYLALYGLAFDGERYNGNGSVGTFYGLRIYDTGSAGRDPDLEPEYPNATSYEPGNVLIIQENSSGPSDDEADGGKFIMSWDVPVMFNELVLIDFEPQPDEAFTLSFSRAGSVLGTYTSNGPGDNLVAFLDESDFGSWTIDELVLDTRASGAISSLGFTPVPEPSSLLFAGTLGAIACLLSRRRR